MGFHLFLFGYLKEKVLCFVDVINKLELAIELKDNNQLIIDSEDEKGRKRLECATNGKTQYNNLHNSV